MDTCINHNLKVSEQEREQSGYINPHQLAPDSEQPRDRMIPSALEDIRPSIRESGVKNPIVVSPVADCPWVMIDSEHADRPYVIVSGHRRHRVAIEEDQKQVPYFVRTYEDEEEFRADQMTLNHNHAPPSELEEGIFFRRQRDKGLNMSRIAKIVGTDNVYVARRIYLTRLAPEFQTMVAPLETKKRALPLLFAEELGKTETPTLDEVQQFIKEYGSPQDMDTENLEILTESTEQSDQDELRFMFQRLLYFGACQASTSSKGRVDFVKNRLSQTISYASGGINRGPRFVPKNRRRVFIKFLSTICNDDVLNWSSADWKRILHNQTPTTTREMERKVEEGLKKITALGQTLSKISKSKTKKGPSVVDQMIRCDYYDDSGGRMPNTLVTREKYVTLWDEGRLGFQHDENEKPAHLPDIEDVRQAIKKSEQVI